MPAKEIKELRESGKLKEALDMATEELNNDPTNIWAKRNLSWVYYAYLKAIDSANQFDDIIKWITLIRDLNFSADEKIFLENLAFQIGRLSFLVGKVDPIDLKKGYDIFNLIKGIPFPKSGMQYSFMFKGLHKLLKDSTHYIEFADWWGFENFMLSDFQKEQMPDGRPIISIAEQAYNAYSKQLLPKFLTVDDLLAGVEPFDPEKVKVFLPKLQKVADENPEFQYVSYYQAKLLLALGEGENVLEKLLPFARKKRNDFWVWEVLADPLNDEDKIFACYCKALSCKSPEEMLIRLRQRMASKLIGRKMFNEAKTEIELLVKARSAKDFKTPSEVNQWQNSDWYNEAQAKDSNLDLYRKYTPIAEAILYGDIPEEYVIVEFVNNDKKILNFIANETKFGFFKFDRFLSKVNIGDVLKVRFQGGSHEGAFQVYTAEKTTNKDFQDQFLKQIQGQIKINSEKGFGFVENIYVHASIIKRAGLKNGDSFNGYAIKTYNKERKEWTWKVI